MFVDLRKKFVIGKGRLMRNYNVGSRIAKRAGDDLFLFNLLFKAREMDHMKAGEKHNVFFVKAMNLKEDVVESRFGKIAQV